MNEDLQKNLVHNKENIYFGLVLLVSILCYITLAFSIIGIVIILVLALISYFFHAISMAQIRRNAVRISPQQFPEIYEKAEKLSAEMGLEKVPAMYVMESMGMLNAFATRFFGKNMVVVYSEIFDLIESDKEDEMLFVLAHEFAHLKRRHVLVHFLILPAMWMPFLGEAYMRACEYTCDRYAAFYIKNMEAAQNALTILAIGKKLHYHVNQEAFMSQLEEEKGFFTWLSEKLSTHPDLPKRMNSLYHWQNPHEYTLFKERKRHVVLVLFLTLGIFPALLFGIFYAVNKADQFLGEYAWSDDASEYEAENVTELMDAASVNDLDTMKKEIDGGADVNAKDSDDSTAIHYAVYNDSHEAAELLVQSGSNLDAKDFYGDTPLMIAAMNGNSKIVELLIKNGANKEIKGEEGYTAYEYAEENGDKEIMKLLAE